MREDMINRKRVMEAITKEYNARFKEGNGLQLAYIEKAVNSVSGWIPIEEALPTDDDYVLLSFTNYNVPAIGRYEEDEDGGGNFYDGDSDEPLIKIGLFVNAWMPLPKCYED